MHKNFEPLDDYLLKAKLKFVTPDSVNMIFESLSSSGETYLFDMHYSKENKITRLIDEVKSNNIREQIVKNSPQDNEDYFVVPKVIE